MIGRPSKGLGVCGESYSDTVEIQSPVRLELEENPARMFKKLAQQGRSERRGAPYVSVR
jgi:hypothetical protein